MRESKQQKTAKSSKRKGKVTKKGKTLGKSHKKLWKSQILAQMGQVKIGILNRKGKSFGSISAKTNGRGRKKRKHKNDLRSRVGIEGRGKRNHGRRRKCDSIHNGMDKSYF